MKPHGRLGVGNHAGGSANVGNPWQSGLFPDGSTTGYGGMTGSLRTIPWQIHMEFG